LASILVVDDNVAGRQFMAVVLEEEGHTVRQAGNGVEGLLALEGGLPELVVTDLDMPEMNGMELLQRVRQRWPTLPVIVASIQEEVDTVVAAVRRGADNYLLKPFSPESLVQAVEKALVPQAAAAPAGEDAAARIRGRSKAIVEVRHLVALAARSDVNILVVGETGTGKEIVSRAVHGGSKLADRPFVAHNCAATPQELFESHFFGHRKGSFTGATQDRVGLLERASGGVCFLDELGSMPIEHQAKLLRVMDDGELVRVGDTEPRRVAVRYVGAINRPPEEMIAAGELRQDLYYRLRGIEFRLPPLRERREDVAELAHHFLEGRAGFTVAALETLAAHDWPGNVRELRNVVQGALAFAGDGPIDVVHLPFGARTAPSTAPVPETAQGLRTLKEIEEDAIRRAIEACGGNQSLTAKALGIDRSTLRRKLAAMERTEPETPDR
jgi:two-component system nitrogen regulation response regulator GlnG